MRALIFMFIVSWGLLILLVTGFVCENRELKYQLSQRQTRIYVQNPCEAQQILKDAGYYHGRIDGIWGKETEKAYCNWAAAQYFKE